MIDIETVLLQRPELFDNLASHWHRATIGRLALLSPYGKVIKSFNGLYSIESIVNIAESGNVEVNPEAEAIVIPLVSHGELKGHLLSVNSTSNYLPLLTWVSEILLDHLNSEQALQGMTDELIVAWDQLELVYRIAQTLGEYTSLYKVLSSTLTEIAQVITVEYAFITFVENEKLYTVSTTLEEFHARFADRQLLEQMMKIDRLVLFNSRAATLEVWPNAPQRLYNFIGVPISTGNTLAVLGLINFQKNGKPHDFSAGHAKLIRAVAEQIGSIFDSFSLRDAVIAQERVRHELEIASAIQMSLMPGPPPQVNGLEVNVTRIPAYEVGGDFYDFVRTDENQLTVMVGDVAGKGIPAAMVTSMIRSMLRVEALHNQEPHTIIKRANEALQEDLGRAELFVTAFVGSLNTKANVLMYANAGHVPAIIYHAQSKTVRLLSATALPIGVAGYDPGKPTQYIHATPGDTLIIYSDGVFDPSDWGEDSGLSKLQSILSQHSQEPPERLKEIILNEFSTSQNLDLPPDDATLVIIKFAPKLEQYIKLSPDQILDTLPFRYAADTVHLSDISQQVTTACRRLNNLPSDSQGDNFVYLVELAVSEIFTNIIEHAYANTIGDITGKITLTQCGIEIDIYDQGQGFNPDAVPPPMSDPMDPTEGGFGLHLVRQIMDVVRYAMDTPQGNHWKLVKYLPD